VVVDFTAPAMHRLVDVMLACEGFAESVELATKVIAVTTASAAKCAKSYDVGLRSLLYIATSAGAIGRAAAFSNESHIVMKALTEFLYIRAVGPDKDVVGTELGMAFGVVEVPEAFVGKHAAAVAAMVAEVAKIRNGLCITGVGNASVKEYVDAIGNAMGAETVLVNLVEDEAADVRISDPASTFVKAFKEVMTKEGPVNLVLQGALGPEAMESFNMLLDDNRRFITSIGEHLHAAKNLKLVFFNDGSTWSPSTCSRLGFVGLGSEYMKERVQGRDEEDRHGLQLLADEIGML